MQHAVHNRATIRVADRTDVSGRVTAAVLVTNQSQIHGREAIERLKQLSAPFSARSRHNATFCRKLWTDPHQLSPIYDHQFRELLSE